jgi:hypothetical protein
MSSMLNQAKSIRQCSPLAAAMMFGLLCSGNTLAETITANPPTGEHVKVAGVTADIAAFHKEVTKFLRDKYAIKSGNYYRFRGDVPWVAISKQVQNQMAEKSIQRVLYDWNNPGYDFVDVYPQGDTAFAVAMYAKGNRGKSKLVGYFVLTAKK